MIAKIAATAHQLQDLLDATEDRDALVWAHGFLVGLSERIGKRIFAGGTNWSTSSGTIPSTDEVVARNLNSWTDDDYERRELVQKCRNLGLADPQFGTYTLGFDGTKPHPFRTSTGNEGRCELCGDLAAGQLHKAVRGSLRGI